MEGIKIVVFALVAVVWLAIWIIRMFRNAFNQPLARGPKPYIPQVDKTISEVMRQQMEKQKQPEREPLERSEPPVARTLEVPEPRRRSLETLKPMGRSQESVLGEFTTQRDDIIRRRREKNIYQIGEKKQVSVYAQMLQNPQTAREAVILAEILKPKF